MGVVWLYADRAASQDTGASVAEGYFYVFPKRDHVNVGVGYVLEHFRGEVGGAPYEVQQDFVAHLRSRGVMEGQSERQNFTPFIVPIGGPLNYHGKGRVLLAGDAGGFVNGITAEGIYYAMVSGDLAARAVLATYPAEVGSLAPRYRRACNLEIGDELRDASMVQRYLFADRRRIASVIAGARADPKAALAVVDYFAGRTSYRDVRRAIACRVPLLAARLAWTWVRAPWSSSPFSSATN